MSKSRISRKKKKASTKFKDSRRLKLVLYTKAPFHLTDNHHKAFLAAVDSIATVQVTYTWTLDRTDPQSLSFGGTSVDLKADSTGTKNVFKSSSPLSVPITNDMLWVVVRTEGKFNLGGGWDLEVMVNGSKIPDSPIKQNIQSNNKADHDQRHLIS